MANISGGAKSGGKGGSSHASNAALDDNEDLLPRRRAQFDKWKRKKTTNQMISYDKSPSPPIKRT